jgi:hypothetical protein
MQVLIAQIRRQRRDVQPVHTVQLVLQNRVIVQLVITASMPVQRRNVTSVILARHALRHRRHVGTLVYRLAWYGQIHEWIVRSGNAQRDTIVRMRQRRQRVHLNIIVRLDQLVGLYTLLLDQDVQLVGLLERLVVIRVLQRWFGWHDVGRFSGVVHGLDMQVTVRLFHLISWLMVRPLSVVCRK